jgi:hypothetical protein
MALENYSFIFNSKTMTLMTLIVIGVNLFAFPNLLSHPDMKLNDLSMLIHDNPQYASKGMITKKENTIEVSTVIPTLDSDNKKEEVKEEKKPVEKIEEKPVEKTEEEKNLKPLAEEKTEDNTEDKTETQNVFEHETEKVKEQKQETKDENTVVDTTEKKVEETKENETKETEPKNEEKKEIAAIIPSEEPKNTKLDIDNENEYEEPAGISSCKSYFSINLIILLIFTIK